MPYLEIGATASQDGLTNRQLDEISCLLIEWQVRKLHLGDCIGGDQQIHDIARKIGDIWIIGHPPINPVKRAFCVYDEERPVKEYIVRNHDIVDESSAMIIGPKTNEEELRSGTWATYRYTKKCSKPFKLIYP